MPIPIPGLVSEALRRSTVSVRSRTRQSSGAGSGVALNDDTIVTNAHVVQSSGLEIESWDGRVVGAKLFRIDRTRDLALLKAPDLRAEPAQLGNSETAHPGTPVFAIGNPLGFTGAMSSGVIHSAYTGNGYRWLCADIRLAPGNSGGPLANIAGQVIGINTMVISGGLALAVPSRSVQSLLRAGHNRQRLGVTLRPLPQGIIILEMKPGSPADAASLRPGDLLVAVNDRPLILIEDLQMAADASERITLDFRRGGEAQLRRVVLQVPRRNSARAA